MVTKISIPNASRRKVRLFALLFVYLIYLLVLTLNPFEFSLFGLRKLAAYDFLNLLFYLIHFNVFDFMFNILLFIPFGMLLYLLSSSREVEKDRRTLWIPICAGAFLSGLIEVAQLFLDRISSVSDLFTNVVGSVLGFYGVRIWQFKNNLLSVRLGKRGKVLIRLMGVICYGGAFVVLALIPSRLNDLRNWNEDFRLLVGNEESLDRPWEGEVFLTAIYNKALRLPEIQRLYNLRNEKNGMEERRLKGAVALYSFSEGRGDTVHDVSGRGELLHLTGSVLRWLEGGRGIKISGGSLLRSPMTGKKIVRALRETSQMTVEVWIRTENLIQSGPARIVSLSGSVNQRNFTLGQDGHDVHLRVRTPLTGLNGSWINLRAKSVLEDLDIHQLTATFYRGVERLFVDGRPEGEIIRGDINFLPYLVKLGRNTTAQLAFCFVVLFPLSLLLYSLFHKGRFILTLISVGGLVSLVQVFYLIQLSQPFGFLFLSASMVTAAFGSVLGSLLMDSGIENVD
jgi:glycopeptide antibiotics resistance protein